MQFDETVPIARLRALYDTQVRPTVGTRLPVTWSQIEEHRTLRAHTGSGVRVYTDGLFGCTEQQVVEEVDSTLAALVDASCTVQWQVHAHDNPALAGALRARGLHPIATTTVLLGRTADLMEPGAGVEAATLREVETQADLQRIAALQTEVLGENWSWLADHLEQRLGSTGGNTAIWLAEVNGRAVGTGFLERIADSALAGFFGGAVHPEFQHRGIFRALVHARAQRAEAMGAEIAWVEATDLSRPILARLGMTAVTTVEAWV